MDYGFMEQKEQRKGLSPEKQAHLSQIIKRDPLDPAPLLEKFSHFELPLAEMQSEVKALQVTDDATSAKCAEMAAQGRKLANQIDKAYKAEAAPYKAVLDALRSCTNGIKDRIKQMVGQLEAKQLPYLAEQRRKKIAAEQAARDEQARLQAAAEAKAKAEAEAAAEEVRKKAEAEGASKVEADIEARRAAAQVEAAPVIVTAAPVIKTSHKGESGSQGIKTETAWEIENFRLLPDAAFESVNVNSHIDGKANSAWPHVWIRACVKAGMKNIPGVRFFELEKVQTRAK